MYEGTTEANSVDPGNFRWSLTSLKLESRVDAAKPNNVSIKWRDTKQTSIVVCLI
jgi:hypothetical protein